MKRKLLQVTLAIIASTFSLNVWGQLSGFYQEDFEGTFPPTGWQTVDVLDPANVWEQSTVIAYSGYNSAHINYTDYTDGEDWLILPQFTVGATDSFSFWMAANFLGYPPDSTMILVSTTDDNLSSFTNVVAILWDDTVGTSTYPPVQNVFYYYSYSLSAFGGQDIYVAFKHKDNYGDGVFIDLVSIGNPVQTTDAVAVSIDVSDFISTNTFAPMATVKNNSIGAESFTATLTATGGYSSTQNVTNLPSGAILQVTFDPWTPNVGTATLSLTTNLAGDVDASNDNISKVVSVLEPFINYGWVSKAAAPTTVWDQPSAAAHHPNGTWDLYILGGISSGNISDEANTYNPVSNSWSSLSAMPFGSYTGSATAINDKIFVIGGYNPVFEGIPDNQIYDIATDSWSNGTPMPTPVGDYGFGVFHDSLIYYIGGYDAYAGTDYDIVQIYDPLTDTWTSGTQVPATGYGWQGGIVGNKIVLSGGANTYVGLTPVTYVGTIDESNPDNISWQQVDDFPSGTVFRGGSAGSIDPFSGLVVFSGGDPNGYGSDVINATFAYDVNSNSWKIGPNKPTAANNLRNFSCIAYGDSLYVASVGGLGANGELDVNEWLNLGPAPLGTEVTPVESKTFDLSSYPNPFSKFTSISFTLDHSSTVKISIVDLMGKEVAMLCDKTFAAGAQQVAWNASEYSAGVYFCKVNVEGNVFTEKLVKLK